ncbi:hypothetical protein [Kitasatospora herbaricolor]|uniref:Uncharacterized protein n=1 Tax=Kitasatospora herbaricolor TaxID=68217 RepID=A0ABZ1W017_9ACTN|nr:hypothetical protein [Kitasatospora herbaricolor]
MTDTRSASELAAVAAGAVRALNRATLAVDGEAPGLTYPGDVYATVAALGAAAGELPQSFEQLLGFLDQLNAAGALRSERDALGAELLEAGAALADAAQAAHALRGALDRALPALGAVGHVQPA